MYMDVQVGVEAVVMTDETVVDVLEVAEKVLSEVSERVKVSSWGNWFVSNVHGVRCVLCKGSGAAYVETSWRVCLGNQESVILFIVIGVQHVYVMVRGYA